MFIVCTPFLLLSPIRAIAPLNFDLLQSTRD